MSFPANGIDLEQYRTQAKELQRAALSGETVALDRVGQSHPEGRSLLTSGDLKLADTQLVIARENGYQSWPKLKADLLFRQAVRALDAGNQPALASLLDTHPFLLRHRCRRGEWYERGYFQGAMLLHHIAGNPIRCPLPPDIVAIARHLLQRGANPNSRTDSGSTTIGLLLTSKQASEAGVAAPLIELLREAGATDDLSRPDTLSLPLTNGALATAEELIRRGAKMDIRHAAGLGRISELEAMLAVGGQEPLIEEALAFAAFHNRNEAARLLVRHGARGDVLVTPGHHAPQTALHNAAWNGNRELVTLLLANGASGSVRDAHWDGTPAGWARHAGHPEIADLIEAR